MSTDESNPFADVPPVWVSLRDAPRLLEERFGFPQRQIAERLCCMVQDGTISHRIGGLADGDVDIPKELNFVDPAQEVVGPPIIMDPPGFEYWLGTFQVGPDQWETADIEWSTGTVAGPRRPDGTRTRLPIELPWSELIKIAASRDDLKWAKHADQNRTRAPGRPAGRHAVATRSDGSGSSSTKPRGRPNRYNWAQAEQALGAELAARGCPRPGDGGQARLEELVRNLFRDDACPSESVIRDKVARAIAAHKAALERWFRPRIGGLASGAKALPQGRGR